MSHVCKYCKKSYTKESSLAVHLCEPKRRWQQEKETGVQWGLQSYLKFYEVTQGSAKLKNYEDFVASPYYSAFVRYGRYCVAVRAINHRSFTEWLLKNNKKLDHWCRDTLYSEWLQTYLKREPVQDAIERALREMQEYADESQELQGNFSDYFKRGNSNRICQHIENGRVSAWVVYNCDSGIAFLDSLNEEQVAIIMPYIDPDFWQQRFRDFVADTEWCRSICRQAGL